MRVAPRFLTASTGWYRDDVLAGEEVRARRWVLPDEPVSVRLMNTVWADRIGVHDDLETSEDLAAWLSDTGLLVPAGTGQAVKTSRTDLALARGTRQALRRLAAAVTEDERPRALTGLREDDAARELNQLLVSSVPGQLSRIDGRWCLHRPALRSVSQALAQVTEETGSLLTNDDHPLRACQAPGCVLYFVRDHPRREWCSTTCGNRARAARHYARHRT